MLGGSWGLQPGAMGAEDAEPSPELGVCMGGFSVALQRLQGSALKLGATRACARLGKRAAGSLGFVRTLGAWLSFSSGSKNQKV